MKIYKNSAILMKEKIHLLLEERLKRRGLVSMGEVYDLIKFDVPSYSVTQRHFREIMNEMCDKGLAIRTIRNGVYVIINNEGLPVNKVNLDYKECSVNLILKQIEKEAVVIDDEPEKVEFVRPPAKYGNTSREETIEKYLNMEI